MTSFLTFLILYNNKICWKNNKDRDRKRDKGGGGRERTWKRSRKQGRKERMGGGGGGEGMRNSIRSNSLCSENETLKENA